MTMQAPSHRYSVQADGFLTGVTVVSASGVPPLQVAASPQVEGSAGLWTPETLLLAAVADSFVLTFRALSQADGFSWQRLQCDVEGALSVADAAPHFARMGIRVDLTVLNEHDIVRALELLHRAQRACAVVNSLRSARTLEVRIHGQPALAA